MNIWAEHKMKMLSVRIGMMSILWSVCGPSLWAQEPAGVPLAVNSSSAGRQSTAFRLPWEDADTEETKKSLQKSVAANAKHPLVPAVQYAENVATQIHQQLRDYTCIIIKRERIEDQLQDFQSMRARVRCARVAADNQPAVPFSVYLEFVAPRKAKGRQVLFVSGQNGGKMLARNGGKRFNYVIVKVDPRSEAATRESLVPITEIGLENMTRILIRLLEENIIHDPSGTNSHLAFYKNAKVNERICTRISVTHPQPNPALGFSSADVYVDDELHVPIRLEAYAWPIRSGAERQLLFEYTYEDLRINVGLSSADFQSSLLQPQTPAAAE
jgi:Protein of unknown function (DUF1571)